MSRGPVPSQLCLLSSLAGRREGDKVRFLGCVTAYSTVSACLTLGHLYPRGSNVTASVNVELVLQTLQPELTRVGEWVNVIGYVTTRSKPSASNSGAPAAHIQALVIWPTGPLDLERYEKSFETAPTRVA